MQLVGQSNGYVGTVRIRTLICGVGRPWGAGVGGAVGCGVDARKSGFYRAPIRIARGGAGARSFSRKGGGNNAGRYPRRT